MYPEDTTENQLADNTATAQQTETPVVATSTDNLLGNNSGEIKNPQALLNSFEQLKKQKKELSENLKKIQEEYNDLQKKLGDVTPEQVHQWRKGSEESQIALLKKEQKFEEALQIKERSIKALTEENTNLNSKYNKLLLTMQLEQAFLEAGGKKSHFRVVQPHLMEISQLDESGKLTLYPNGTQPLDKNGQPKKNSEVIFEEFGQSDLYGTHFEPTNIQAGTGANTSQGRIYSKQTLMGNLEGLTGAQKRAMAYRYKITE